MDGLEFLGERRPVGLDAVGDDLPAVEKVFEGDLDAPRDQREGLVDGGVDDVGDGDEVGAPAGSL
ncbi:hypothetical protein DN402_31470 [Streptomyces sp. SW4]|nr:hypothetical protein DN402_31470 [Streptomyces sp. SW4]